MYGPKVISEKHKKKVVDKKKKLYSLIKFWKNQFFYITPKKLSITANMLRKMYKNVNFSEVHKGADTGEYPLKYTKD